MRLEDILENRSPGKTMQAHNWASYCWMDEEEHIILNVNHHWTQMLQFRVRSTKPYMPIPIRYVSHVDIGQGSKSDQKGMNRIFIKLGLPWYYARNNANPRIIQLPHQVSELPVYLRDRKVRVDIFGYSA